MNHLFHINIFSQISPVPSSPIEGGDIGVVAPSEGGNTSINKIRTAVATGLLALSLSAGSQERPTATIMTDTRPILLAQASTETDGKVYVAEVIQVDGTKKTIKYFRSIDGVIIPPPIIDGKLIDGSNAPDDAMRAKIAQKKILVKYDKSALMAIAMVGPKDLITDAIKNIDLVSKLAEQGSLISKEQIQNRLLGIYILILSGEKVDGMMKLTDTIATTQLKMNASELMRMKQEMESKAKNIWKSATGAAAVA